MLAGVGTVHVDHRGADTAVPMRSISSRKVAPVPAVRTFRLLVLLLLM